MSWYIVEKRVIEDGFKTKKDAVLWGSKFLREDEDRTWFVKEEVSE